MSEVVVPVVAAPSLPARIALRIVQAGAIAVVVAVSTFRIFELDRFFVPKELALHLTALLAGIIVGRSLRNAGLGRPLVEALAFAVFAIALTSLLQTYGVDIELFSENRAPGGTLGNRNFVAQLPIAVATRSRRFPATAMRARDRGARSVS